MFIDVIISVFVYSRIQDDLKSPANATQNVLANSRSSEVRDKPLRQNSVSSDIVSLTPDTEGIVSIQCFPFNNLIS